MGLKILSDLKKAIDDAFEMCADDADSVDYHVSVIVPENSDSISVYRDKEIVWIIGDTIHDPDEFAEE